MLGVLFLAYPTVTQIAFASWPCYEFDSGSAFLNESAVLIADVKIVCHSEEHHRAQNWAISAVVIYPGGLLVGCLLLLLAACCFLLAACCLLLAV